MCIKYGFGKLLDHVMGCLVVFGLGISVVFVMGLGLWLF